MCSIIATDQNTNTVWRCHLHLYGTLYNFVSSIFSQESNQYAERVMQQK